MVVESAAGYGGGVSLWFLIAGEGWRQREWGNFNCMHVWQG